MDFMEKISNNPKTFGRHMFMVPSVTLSETNEAVKIPNASGNDSMGCGSTRPVIPWYTDRPAPMQKMPTPEMRLET